VISKFLGKLQGEGGEVEVDKSHVTTASVLFDAVYIPGGSHVETLLQQGDALHFINEAFKHGKPIGASGEGVALLRASAFKGVNLADSAEAVESQGVVTVAGAESMTDRVKGTVGMSESTGMGGFTQLFMEALAQHRHWGRDLSARVPA
jgi:catalase